MAARRKAKRMGRPPGPPEQVRRHRVTTTFTDDELATLERMAEERGLPVGTMLYEFVRRRLGPRQ